MVIHDGGEFLFGEVDVVAAALLLATVHEGSLEGELVGVGAGEGCVDVVEALGGDFEDAGAEDVGPVVGGEVACCGTVDEGVDHLGGGGGFGERWVVVADGDGCNLSIAVVVRTCKELQYGRVTGWKNLHIEKGVTVDIDDVVALALGIVGNEVNTASVPYLFKIRTSLVGLRTREGCLDRGLSRLVSEESAGRAHGCV